MRNDSMRFQISIGKTGGIRRMFAACAFLLAATGCVKSPDPTVGELILIAPPVFTLSSGTGIVTVTSQNPTLVGTCDNAGYGLSYAIDQTTTWTPIPGDCVNGHFSFTIPLHRNATVYARAKTKLAYTSLAQIRLRYVPPPSSPSLTLVQAASSNDDNPRNIQSVVGHSIGGNSLTAVGVNTITNSTIKVHTYLPGIVYGQ